jgi:branched-chain amino acid aminotransferase
VTALGAAGAADRSSTTVQKTDKIWFDGRLVPWDEASVHITTHTLHYGLGVFEGIRCYECGDGRSAIFRLSEHNARLYGSARILAIDVPIDMEAMNKACCETVRANGLRSCYIRPIVFIGAGELGLRVRTNPIHVAIIAWPWGAYLGEEGMLRGIRVKTSSFQRFHVNTLMTRAKAVGHYVNSILANHEACTAGYDEALLLDTDGFVAEGSGENIFVVQGGVVKTTPLASILGGITRDTAMAVLRESGRTVIEERFTRDAVYLADEAFFTGTAAEVTPIRELDDRPIGSGDPGPVTKRLQETFFRIVRGEESRYSHWLTYV